MLPQVGGVLAVVLVAFAVWVHSMPPPAPAVLVQEATATTTTPPQQLNLEMLESLGPEVLARAGLTREDLEKMTFSTQETTASAASTSEADEKISLDDEEVPRQEKAPPSEDHNTATTIDEL